jgi:hypothetical protein
MYFKTKFETMSVFMVVGQTVLVFIYFYISIQVSDLFI